MTVANLLGALEGPELLIILALVVLLFGGSKLPQLARSLGQAKKEFHHGMADGDEDKVKPPVVAATVAPAEETVTISKAELDRLRRAAPDVDA